MVSYKGSSQMSHVVQIHDPVHVPDKECHDLEDLKALFRSPKNADINLRKAILRQYINILTSNRILVSVRVDSNNSHGGTKTVWKPPRIPLTKANFVRGGPEFIHFFITEVLPGEPKNTTAILPCTRKSFDDRLYQFPTIPNQCGVKSGWNPEMRSLSEEDTMLIQYWMES
ncbi:Oidioi.mRNA.OKI2018_I69.chr1.g40.t1.cds [Oikopleura dioica]|uniref:Oidioi.mRNA.OKI2018_I69.chr1.g40.t1.cds n=1 Tax=Oikopleura dioica TaxID=34765 RepID=A0ABN7SN55_OIKDI|nr:Oidioi.mRNA.OKI2018_I69.chr1.g40.t1.cds [Oikopleura dioica]